MNDDSVSVCAGLGYHACWTQVCILSEDGQELCNRRVPSEPPAIAATIARVGTPRIVAIEACSGAATLAQRLNEGFGFMTKLSHPGYVKRMRHSPDKSDLSDARILAELARNGFLPEVWLAPEWIRQLRSLVHRRSQVVQQRRAAKVRLRALLREMRIARPQGLIRIASTECASVRALWASTGSGFSHDIRPSRILSLRSGLVVLRTK